MNKCSILLLVAFVLMACRSDNNEAKRESSSQQTLTGTQSQTIDSVQVRRDSIEQRRKLEEAQVAYGKIRFGDSFGKLSNQLRTFETIGSYEYITRTHFVDSKHEKDLFQLDFRSYTNNTANYYDTYIRNSWTNLISIISQKYGRANEEYGYPSFFHMKSGYITWTHIWKISTKEIRIGVGEDESTYYSILRILDSNRQTLVESRARAEEAKKQSESSRKF